MKRVFFFLLFFNTWCFGMVEQQQEGAPGQQNVPGPLGALVLMAAAQAHQRVLAGIERQAKRNIIESLANGLAKSLNDFTDDNYFERYMPLDEDRRIEWAMRMPSGEFQVLKTNFMFALNTFFLGHQNINESYIRSGFINDDGNIKPIAANWKFYTMCERFLWNFVGSNTYDDVYFPYLLRTFMDVLAVSNYTANDWQTKERVISELDNAEIEPWNKKHREKFILFIDGIIRGRAENLLLHTRITNTIDMTRVAELKEIISHAFRNKYMSKIHKEKTVAYFRALLEFLRRKNLSRPLQWQIQIIIYSAWVSMHFGKLLLLGLGGGVIGGGLFLARKYPHLWQKLPSLYSIFGKSTTKPSFTGKR